LIQLVGTLCLIAMISIILLSIKTVSDRAREASEARRRTFAPLIRETIGATSAVSNHNNMARQADQALKSIQ
jgi:hypothetical protein